MSNAISTTRRIITTLHFVICLPCHQVITVRILRCRIEEYKTHKGRCQTHDCPRRSRTNCVLKEIKFYCVTANIYPLGTKKYKRCHCSKSRHWMLISNNVHFQFKKEPSLWQFQHNVLYCGIIITRGGSIFVLFIDSPPPQISTKTYFEIVFLLKLKPMHSENYIPTNKQTTHDPLKLTPTILNDSTVPMICYQFLMFVKLIYYKQNQ